MQHAFPRWHSQCTAHLLSIRAVCLLACCAVPAFASAEEITNSVGMKLRLLEAGRYERGQGDLAPGFHKDHSEFNSDNDERPVHPVVLTKPFYLATTEVTVAQFRQFVNETQHKTSAEQNELGAVGWDPTPPADNPRFISTFRDGGGFDWNKPGFEQGDSHPVVGVSFTDAKAYCEWLSKKEGVTYRLPTEAEWEYAARAGTETYFSFGDVYRGQIHRHANIGNVELEEAFPDRVRRQWLVDVERDPADEHVFTAPVGSYQANPWGLFDLYGNVWEWCEDRYLDTAYTSFKRAGYQQVRKRAIDPFNDKKGSDEGDWRVIRGGSWFNSPIQCRSGVRGYFEASDAACYVGFRVAREATAEAIEAARNRFAESEAARATIKRILQGRQFQERRDGRLSLLLQRDNLSDEFIESLKQLDEPVDLHLNGSGRLTAEVIAALTSARDLRGLLLTQVGADIVDSDFAALENHPKLELLQITGAPKLTNALFQYLKQHDRLELLELESDGITDDGLIQLPALEHLNLLQLHQTASQGLVLERFQKSPLRKFSCRALTDESARHLAHFPLLNDLRLAGSPITGAGLKVISQLALLTRLELSGCVDLKDEDLALLGNLGELSALILSQTDAGDAAMGGIVRLNKLRELHIGSPSLSDAGVRKSCEMVSLTDLLFTADAVNVTDAGLADLWRLVNLRSLTIDAPQVSGKGLASLAEMPKLTRLQLGGQGIGIAAFRHAAQSASLTNLFVGNWSNGGPAALTDAGIQELSASRSLTQFDLIRKQTQVTDEGVEQLRRQRPQLKVNIR